MTPEEFDKLIKQKAKELETYVVARFPAESGNTAIRFINGNFRAQGWQGSTFSAWPKNKRGGTTLIQTGHLRSATYYVTSPGTATIRNTEPYADIHNEGGDVDIPVTAQMRKFFWAMYYKEAGKGIKTNKAGAQYQSIEVGRKANKWRSMALTKKQVFNLTLPRRQFMPTASRPSPVLNKAIQRNIARELERLFKL